MLPIPGITAQPYQSFTVPLPDGTKLAVSMMYFDQNSGWYFQGLNWHNGQWQENGRRIVSHPNMLRQYRNILTFGLACGYTKAPAFVNSMREPTNIQDFSSGTFSLYVVTASEVAQFETWLQGLKNAQVPA
jgi:hypothetical protein